MKWLKRVCFTLTGLLLVVVGTVFFLSKSTENEIVTLQNEVINIAEKSPALTVRPLAELQVPEPVKRYFNYTFVDEITPYRYVSLTASGDFRRPLTEGFNPTTAEQVIAINTPALMFSATTTMPLKTWARAYDFFANGEMVMKAKILSTVTVVEEFATPKLNQISLRRWLLESALYPQALLPSNSIKWQAIDDNSARVTVSDRGVSASMVAHFDEIGRMTKMVAEEDGDLTTPYHGSGEQVSRGDYRLVAGQMIPHQFTISRAAKGETYPFWQGQIMNIKFNK